MHAKKTRYFIVMGVLVLLSVVAIAGTIHMRQKDSDTIAKAGSQSDAQYAADVVKYEYDGGYMKISSQIIEEDFGTGVSMNASLEDFKQLALQTGEYNYTCEIKTSADEKKIEAGFYEISKNGAEAVEAYLDGLIQEGTIALYKTGLLETGTLKDYYVEQDGDTTTLTFTK